MKKLLCLLALFCLCGCTKEKQNVCKMSDEPYEWLINYQVNEQDNVDWMEQIVRVEAKDEKEKQEYIVLIEQLFNEYVDTYGDACEVVNSDQGLNVERILYVNFHKLTQSQKDEMGFAEEEDRLITQLEYAGYKCD